MTESRILIERHDAVAHVILNRPEKRNGLDLAMFEAIIVAGETLKEDSSVRAVVLSGAGKVFCAGLDFAAFMASGDIGKKLLDRPAGQPANIAQRAPWIWREVPVPVIAAVHGAAYGGGLQIALGADLRVVHPEAKLCVMEIQYGLIPDMAISRSLTTLVRLDVAKDLTFTGRIVTGEEAFRLGLATRLSDDPVEAALGMAQEIAEKSPHAIRAGKQMFEELVTGDVTKAFARETELQLPLLGSRNQMEAVQATFQKRSPQFTDPD